MCALHFIGAASLQCPALCQPANKQLQRTVMDKVPRHIRQRAAAELRRYAARLAGAMLLCVALSGCASGRTRSAFGECSPSDKVSWALGAPGQSDTDAIRALADRNRTDVITGIKVYPVESWFTRGPDEVLLCRSWGPLQHAPSGEWWILERMPDGWRITNKSCWGCILVFG